MLDTLTVGAVAALRAHLRALVLGDAGVAVGVDEEDEGTGSGVALAASRKMMSRAVSVVRRH